MDEDAFREVVIVLSGPELYALLKLASQGYPAREMLIEFLAKSIEDDTDVLQSDPEVIQDAASE